MPLWAKLADMRSFQDGLLTETHRQALVQACLRNFNTNIGNVPEKSKEPTGGLILPEADFDALMDRNGRVKNTQIIYRQTLCALYSDLLDRDGTALFWRMYYCNCKALTRVDGEIKKNKNRCRSLFCPSCRTEIHNRRKTRAKKKFGHLPKNRLYFLTVLHKCSADLDNIKQDVKSFKAKMKRAFTKADRLSPIEMKGSMEIDLKHPSLYEVATK
jgi:hypothetical protein